MDSTTTPTLNTDDASRFSAFKVFKEASGEVRPRIVQLSLDDLSPGDVVIRTAYAGLNYKDALATTSHGNVIRSFPCVGGSDASGTVVSSNHSSFKPGDEVVVFARGLGIQHDGGFSEYIRVPAAWVTPLPKGLTLFHAAALGIAGYTAALSVHLLQANGLKPEHGKVLVNGATGSVASMATEMLAKLGYQIVAMSGKSDHAGKLKSIGATEVVSSSVYRDEGKPLESGLWAAALDSVGGQQLSWILRSTQPRGIVASIGNVAGNEFATNVLPFILRGVRLIGVNVSYYLDIQNQLWDRLAGDLMPQNQIRSVKAIGLEQLPGQLERMLEGRTAGRTVLSFETLK